MSPLLINNIFLPLLGGTIVFVLLEAITLAVDVIEIAIGCRLIIILLLFLAYRIKCRVIERNVTNQKCVNLVHSYSYFLACICLITIMMQLFILYFTKRKAYALLICLLSLLVFMDEYYDIEWLTEIQITRKHANRNKNRKRETSGTEEEEEMDFILIDIHQEEVKSGEYMRISLYNHIFLFLMAKMSLINDFFYQRMRGQNIDII
jgi:hypothetical protein